MPELSPEDIINFSKISDIGGTEEDFSVPLMYRFLVRYLSPIVRFTFNISYTGLERLPSKGPMILTSNHVSNLDPIFKILLCRQKAGILSRQRGALSKTA